MATYTKKERRERVFKYFIETPVKPNNLLWIGSIIALSVLVIKGYWQGGGIGVFLVLLGLIGLYVVLKKLFKITKEYRLAFNRAEPKATDAEMDEWLDTGYRIVLEEAKRRLGLDDDDISTHPLQIDGPDATSLMRPGKDRVLRFSHHNILLLFLTDHNIATYKCIFDLGIGEILQDSTKEFPYHDITNLETKTAADTFHYYKGSEKTRIGGVQTLSLHTSGGNHIGANYFFSRDRDTEEDYKAPPSTAELTIKAIRRRLTEYKNRYSEKDA